MMRFSGEAVSEEEIEVGSLSLITRLETPGAVRERIHFIHFSSLNVWMSLCRGKPGVFRFHDICDLSETLKIYLSIKDHLTPIERSLTLSGPFEENIDLVIYPCFLLGNHQ